MKDESRGMERVQYSTVQYSTLQRSTVKYYRTGGAAESREGVPIVLSRPSNLNECSSSRQSRQQCEGSVMSIMTCSHGNIRKNKAGHWRVNGTIGQDRARVL